MVSLPKEIDEATRQGDRLAGDDYSPPEIRRWFAEEKEAFFNEDAGKGATDPYYTYMRSLTARLAADAISPLRRSNRSSVLVLGPGTGLEVETVLGAGNRWNICFVEASLNFREQLRARFPDARVLPADEQGHIPEEDASQDLVLALSVLHHIPNVSFVLRELHRVLKRDGYAIVREPCSSMGDWRLPRQTTPNERGISRKWFVKAAAATGFTMQRDPVPVLFHPLALAVKRLGLAACMKSSVYFYLDLMLSRLVSPIDTYWRDSFWKKLGPSAYLYVLQK